jgi:hypothetical protein
VSSFKHSDPAKSQNSSRVETASIGFCTYMLRTKWLLDDHSLDSVFLVLLARQACRTNLLACSVLCTEILVRPTIEFFLSLVIFFHDDYCGCNKKHFILIFHDHKKYTLTLHMDNVVDFSNFQCGVWIKQIS